MTETRKNISQTNRCVITFNWFLLRLCPVMNGDGKTWKQHYIALTSPKLNDQESEINSFYLETVLHSPFVSVLMIYDSFWMDVCLKFETNV